MRKRVVNFGAVLLLTIAILAGGAFAASQRATHADAYAGAEVVGNPDDANLRAVITSNGTDRVKRIVYFKVANYPTGGANTPVPSSPFCDIAGDLHYAEFKMTGTMTGTTPTLAILWQNSKDDKSTWSNVGTWVTIDETTVTTPANLTQKQTVADLRAATAVVYGDCWRVLYTMTGTNAAANFSVIGIDK